MVFTGIVETMGTVGDIVPIDKTWSGGAGFSITINDASPVLEDVHLGDSIAVNGICLTVTEFDEAKTFFKVGIAPETMRKTNILEWKKGDIVNLERAMNSFTRFGGHMVQGHVDTTVTLISKTPDPPNSLILTFRVPEPSTDTTASSTSAQPPSQDLLPYIIPKGYVCLNGTSLTVIDVNRSERTFQIMLVAYTQSHVNLPKLDNGSRINLEVDEVGKYVESVVRGFLLGDTSGSGDNKYAKSSLLEDMVRKVVAEEDCFLDEKIVTAMLKKSTINGLRIVLSIYY
ncbi:Riboflavin synthase alpha chain [Blyttiomyces sp. JEL0837]|nr:Riboflavin synthase alpha chain [Blyttiomyces sp. JEL0837]